LSDLPKALERLVKEFSRFPGIGPRTAQRLAFFALARSRAENEQFSHVLLEAVSTLAACGTCGALAAGGGVCGICGDPERDPHRLCVVEEARDVFALERSGAWRGVYHVLGGAISPLEGIGPESLRIEPLLDRVRGGEVTEVVLATDVDPEGETTAAHLADQLRPLGVPLSRLALGLPTGAQLEYGDPATLATAVAGRRPL
jgi:recombination protein RecR